MRRRRAVAILALLRKKNKKITEKAANSLKINDAVRKNGKNELGIGLVLRASNPHLTPFGGPTNSPFAAGKPARNDRSSPSRTPAGIGLRHSRERPGLWQSDAFGQILFLQTQGDIIETLINKGSKGVQSSPMVSTMSLCYRSALRDDRNRDTPPQAGGANILLKPAKYRITGIEEGRFNHTGPVSTHDLNAPTSPRRTVFPLRPSSPRSRKPPDNRRGDSDTSGSKRAPTRQHPSQQAYLP